MFETMPRAEYTQSLLETFYLKLLQHEDIGHEYDIIDVNVGEEVDIGMVSYHPAEFKLLVYKTINKSDMVSFLRDSKDRIINYIY